MYCTSRNAKQKYFSKQIMELIQAKKNDGLSRISAFFSVNKYWVMSEVKCDAYYTLKERVKRLSPNYWSGLPKEPSLIPIIWLR